MRRPKSLIISIGRRSAHIGDGLTDWILLRRARIERSIARLAEDNISNVKSVGGGVHELKIDFGPGYRIYFGWQGRTLIIILGGGTKKRRSKDIAEAKERWSDFKFAVDKQGRPLTISHDEVVAARVKRDPKFATAMLCEGVAALFDGELAVGKHMLRNYVNGAIGFEKLARKVKIPIKSLMRMLGPSGNPRMINLFAIIGALQEHAGVELHLAAE